MRALWRPLLLAAAFTVIVAAGAATAQTVVVIKAPPGATVELGLNAATIGTTKADAAGTATLPVNLASHGRRAEADTRIYVDICENARRVTLIELGWQPPSPAAGCTRHELFGVFYLKNTTTLVISAAEQSQAVWIKQGPAPPEWLRDAPVTASDDQREPAQVASGLVLFGGAGLSKYSKAAAFSCGNVTDCTSDDRRLAWRFGGEFWIRPFLAASVAYLKPGGATTQGTGASYPFHSSLDPNVVTIAGKVALPVSRFRVYGELGTSYNWTTLSTSQTLAERTITVGDTTEVVAGGTQLFELKTDGWSWMFGAGGEIWLNRSVAAYGEYTWIRLKGKASGGGEGTLDERLDSLIFGVRFHLGGKR
jgi:hypothetical protein